ncbi:MULTISPECIES: phosphoenolpyruvate--protein phosphotransferase [pseudomallei group]|uniref:Phosphoenolpyruvate-protein phosphotransferase n=2 Tax=Pseudomonadota TaxID=1224 RepID=A2S621_BURM9|nr:MULTISPECIES: phosphoenolpyruvate--protein phosphotransferase [pseudomallei group]ABM51134.1 phosphoenolpyruvate-protein phosphotransferase [Burkholderia mallei SAVP1]ABN00671.1 phosphoenolpyruvate-protein phosphotransferase [Burkholderia mallei NCTC 10229]ABO06331.1 phosphoenolpyruvate-protein phosphotransferase [Burkholderia mallei NCTC 10247]EDK54752.1 phosphoenolpyruvate-protein phosphotransferase [Burkholderia mallei FMH]EDK59721.1 phosphoenolpyruvate-protein phosphotransferase [Burkho
MIKEVRVSFTLHGIPVSRGIAIGRAYLIAPAALDVAHYLIEAERIEAEIERFRTALGAVRRELDVLRADLTDDTPTEVAAFIDVHAMILGDAMLVQETIDLIRTRRYNVEWALTEQLDVLAGHFDDIEDEYLRERKADIEQVVERVLKALAGAPSAAQALDRAAGNGRDEMIVVAHDIAPADMMQFKTQSFQAFVTDLGGRTSHTAIVARSLGIPAAVGVQHASALIRQDDLIIVDGDQGIVIVDPAPIVLEEYSYRQSEKALEQRKLQRLKFSPAQTLCGTKIDLLANIELPDDAKAAVDAGAVGVGLFRTEFLFMSKVRMPEEEEQFAAYKRAVELMHGMPVTIRTIDVGADKPLDVYDEGYETAPNPALGLRAIRWSLSEPQMFLTQLRAILRASAFGQVKILVPMLAHAQEIDQTLDLINEAKRQLDAAGLAYDPNVRVGAMIEIPAAAIALPLFLKRVDFLSIGTNDLIQYTLAIDRADNAVAHLYDPLHPAVLHLIAFTLREAKRAGVPVSVCGEMAGDPALTRLLLGMGLTEFSMHPSQLLVVKQEILRAHLKALEKPTADVLASFEPEEVQAALARLASAEPRADVAA